MIVSDWAYEIKEDVRFYRICGSTSMTSMEPGGRPVSRAGRGMEWLGRREYTPGDPQNMIDWRAFARDAHLKNPPLYVKTFDAELANLTTIAVDGSASMCIWPENGKMPTAMGAALLMAWAAVNHGDPVEIVCPGAGGKETFFSTRIIRGVMDFALEMKRLEELSPGAASLSLLTDPSEGLKGSRRTLLLISDFYEPIETISGMVRELQNRVRTVLAVRIRSPLDETMFYEGEDVELCDVENPSERMEVSFSRGKFLEMTAAHEEAVAEELMDHGILFADIDAIPLKYEENEKSLPGSPGPRDVIDRLIEAGLLI